MTGLLGRMSKTTVGVLIMLLIALISSAAYYKELLSAETSALFGSDTFSAEFEKDFKLVEYRPGGDVKIAGVKVGTVTDIETTETGTSIVIMLVEDGTREKLGSAPAANIWPTLVLGGRYFVELTPGGEGPIFAENQIPLERTEIPVELERLFSPLTPDAQQGMQAAVRQLDGFLELGGTDALRDLAQNAPGTLDPAAAVLEAFQGTEPTTDLTELVSHFRAGADAFTRRTDQVDAVITAVDDSTAAIAAGSRPWADSFATLPETMRTTRAGMADLQPTLDRLTTAAEEFRPAARELDPMFAELDPALAETDLLLDDLQPLITDARPLFERLVPVTDQTTAFFDDLRGPVLDRLNGPIVEALTSPWVGEGVYAGGGAVGPREGHLLYEEVGYLASHSAQAFGWHDANGAFARLSVGLSLETAAGALPKPANDQLEQLGVPPYGGVPPLPSPDREGPQPQDSAARGQDGALPLEQLGGPR